jgi:hypothetical protein
MDDLVERTIACLKRNAFNTFHARNVDAARAYVLETIPVGVTVGVGDSVSVRQLDVLSELAQSGRLLVDPFSQETSILSTKNDISEDQRWEMHKLAVNCEYFITGSNAITRDGKLVNTDGGGNRVGGMIFGPKQVIIVAGTNKIVEDVEEAFWRIKNVIAPQLARIKGIDSPCVRAGRCVDCHGPERICNVTTILERAPTYTGVTVVLVDQDLGLSWAENWSQKRKDRIVAECDALTWLRRRPMPPIESR